MISPRSLRASGRPTRVLEREKLEEHFSVQSFSLPSIDVKEIVCKNSVMKVLVAPPHVIVDKSRYHK